MSEYFSWRSAWNELEILGLLNYVPRNTSDSSNDPAQPLNSERSPHTSDTVFVHEVSEKWNWERVRERELTSIGASGSKIDVWLKSLLSFCPLLCFKFPLFWAKPSSFDEFVDILDFIVRSVLFSRIMWVEAFFLDISRTFFLKKNSTYLTTSSAILS